MSGLNIQIQGVNILIYQMRSSVNTRQPDKGESIKISLKPCQAERVHKVTPLQKMNELIQIATGGDCKDHELSSKLVNACLYT